MFGNSVRIGRILGIEIRVDYSWFIVFVLVTWSLAGQHFPSTYQGWSSTTYWIIGILTSLLFFFSVLAHELAHSLVSEAFGVPVKDITLFIFGGAARISDEPQKASGEFWMALAGPLTSLGIAAISGFVWLVSRIGNPYLHALASWLGVINLSLALFNLIPGFPLDGGRIFRALVWAVTGNLRRATRIATNLGRLVAYGFILWGVVQLFSGNWVNGLWIAFIGWFLDHAATSSYQRVALREMLAGHTAREVMNTECQWVPPDLALDALIDQVILPTGRRCFPVQEGGRLQGLLTLHRISQVPRHAWKDTRVGDVMIPRTELKIVHPDDELDVILERMTSEDVNQFLVLDADELLGMVARDNLLNFIRIRSELGL
ncbi:MAG: site-2 protease family protein [Anaerolineae bacterium]